MKMVISFILLSLFSTSSFGDNLSGSWLEIELRKGNSVNVECPFAFDFDNLGRYSILNDCYGDNPKLPEVETGNFELDNKGNGVLNRVSISNDTIFINKPNKLNFKYKIEGVILKLTYPHKGGAQTLTLKKVSI
jgi:hypothetical protein